MISCALLWGQCLDYPPDTVSQRGRGTDTHPSPPLTAISLSPVSCLCPLYSQGICECMRVCVWHMCTVWVHVPTRVQGLEEETGFTSLLPETLSLTKPELDW